jgi:hypothetical protein
MVEERASGGMAMGAFWGMERAIGGLYMSLEAASAGWVRSKDVYGGIWRDWRAARSHGKNARRVEAKGKVQGGMGLACTSFARHRF